MTMIKNLIMAAGLTLLSTGALAQTDVAPYVPGSTLEGVNYYMPRTALRIVVTAQKTVTTPGEYHRYANKYLRLTDVPTEKLTTWSIQDIRIDPYGTPDPTKAYTVKVKSKTVAPLVSLSHDGILLSINQETAEEALPELPQSTPAPKPLNPRDYMTQEILFAGSQAKMAELCAEEIYDIRESRSALCRGEAENTPKDGAQLQLMLDRLDEQARGLEQLFKGTEEVSTQVFTIDYVPTEETEHALLCRFSTFLGLVDADNLAGEPLYISIKSKGNLPAAVENEAVTKKKEKMEKGVFYNMPAQCTISVFDAKHTFATVDTPIAQLGTTEVLSEDLFNKKPLTRVYFYQHSGAIKRLESE